MPILLDFESRSRAKLDKVGGRLYWEDPSTEAICAVLHDTCTGEWGVWFPGDPRPVGPGDVLVAHNAKRFDRFAAAKVWRTPIGFAGAGAGGPWRDSSEEARKTGLPGALDALGSRWLGRPKDHAGSAVTKALSLSPVRGDQHDKATGAVKRRGVPDDLIGALKEYARTTKRDGRWAPIPPAVLERVVEYNVDDVEIMAHGWPLLEPWLDVDVEAQAVDWVVNDRGVRFDSQLARRLLEEDARNAELAIAAIARELNTTPEHVRAVAGSPQQFTWETGAPNAQAETVEQILAAPAHWGHAAVAFARARQAIASIARGKLEAGLLRVSADGRLRDSLRYFGAHTGRWSHRGMQLGNMPRPAKRFEAWTSDDVERLADAVLAGEHVGPEEIDLLVRATLITDPGNAQVVCDYSGVENRALAFYAGDHAAIDVITGGLDPYRVAAATIFGVPYDSIPKQDVRRNAGKMSELACGYGGGVNALLKIARSNRVDLESTGADPATIVRGYRDLHRPVTRLWREVEQAFGAAVQGYTATVSAFTFVPSDDGRDVAIVLPSGRPIVYNDVRIGRDERGRPRLSYLGTKPGREHTYGGKLVENIIQATCRELMADATVRCERDGLPVVLTVHDEIVCEVPARARDEALEHLKTTMLTLPEWAEGFPIGAAGHTGKRYRK